MTLTPAILTTYGLLAAALLSTWCPPVRVGKLVLPLWTALLAAACISALAVGILTWPGLAGIVLLAGLAWAARQTAPGAVRTALLIATGLLVLVLSLHKWPGFANPALVTNLQVSANAPPFTQYLNFDKGAAGLLLFALLCQPANSARQWRQVLAQWPVMAIVAGGVMGLGTLLGVVAPDVKLSAYTPAFLFCNLIFTCIAEEAFFRGFLQHRLALSMQRWQAGAAIALLISALLFGLAHAGGGLLMIALSTLAGLGYGYAFLRSARVEAAILAHFALNALHFLAFTYPRAL